jgi:acetyl esterase
MITSTDREARPTGAAPGLTPFLRERIGTAPDRLPADVMRSATDWVPPADIRVLHLTVPWPDGGVPVRVYRADPDTEPARTAPRPALLWLHGGGFQGGSLDWGEAHVVGAELAARTGTVVVGVDYRTGSYARCADDAARAWAWTAEHARTLGADGPVLVGGASAGANLALTLAAGHRTDAVPRPDGFIGAYGVYHEHVDPLDPATAAVMDTLPEPLRFRPSPRSVDAPIPGSAEQPWAAVPGDGDLGAVPPTTLICCEYDDLRPSTERLAGQLADSGVPVSLRQIPGVLHGHLNWLPGPGLPQVEQTLGHLADALSHPPTSF